MPAAARIGATLLRGGVTPPRGFPSMFFRVEPGWRPCQYTRMGKDAAKGRDGGCLAANDLLVPTPPPEAAEGGEAVPVAGGEGLCHLERPSSPALAP